MWSQARESDKTPTPQLRVDSGNKVAVEVAAAFKALNGSGKRWLRIRRRMRGASVLWTLKNSSNASVM